MLLFTNCGYTGCYCLLTVVIQDVIVLLTVVIQDVIVLLTVAIQDVIVY